MGDISLRGRGIEKEKNLQVVNSCVAKEKKVI
jgi:hypothetical protein